MDVLAQQTDDIETVQTGLGWSAMDCYYVDSSRQYRRFSRLHPYHCLRWRSTKGGHKMGHSFEPAGDLCSS
jgi:hypothetical protein